MENHNQKTNSLNARPLAVGPAEAARLVGVGRTKIYELLSGELASFKVGTRRLIRVAELERWLTAQNEL